MSSSPVSVTVGIVNYNGADYLPSLLASLAAQTISHATIVVDNASHDGSARAAYQSFPQHTYLPLRRNTGFAHAANLIARKATSDVIVYVNPDAVLAPDFVELTSAPFEHMDTLGAIGGTLVFDTAPDVIASAGIDIHQNGVAIDRLLGKRLTASTPEPVFGGSGGAVAYRRSAFLDVGGFPDHFFMYLEDADLAFRLQLAGWDALWQPAAVARHAYSAAAIEGSPMKRRLLARNRIWMLARCFPVSLARSSGAHIALHDFLALGHGILRDRPSALGRGEALARILPRLCERRQIRPDDGAVERVATWLQPAMPPIQLLRLRRLTARLARSG